MAGRNHMPRRPDNYRSFRHGPRPVLSQRSGPLHIHPAILEEELEMQYREMQQIISENRLVVDDNTHLQRELATAKDDIHQLEQVIPRLQAEKEVHARELIERGLKLEAELRASVPLNEEVVQLRTEVQHLTSLRQELTSQVKGFTQDVTHLETENKQLTTMRSDIEALHEDLVEARFEIGPLFRLNSLVEFFLLSVFSWLGCKHCTSIMGCCVVKFYEIMKLICHLIGELLSMKEKPTRNNLNRSKQWRKTLLAWLVRLRSYVQRS